MRCTPQAAVEKRVIETTSVESVRDVQLLSLSPLNHKAASRLSTFRHVLEVAAI